MAEKKLSVYATIAGDILSKIHDGTYPVGTLLPPERELMGIYKVQRTTVRRGLDILSSKGHIKKAAGLGSIVYSLEPLSEVEENTSDANFEHLPSRKTKNICFLLESGKTPDTLPSSALDIISALGKYANVFTTSSISELPTDSDGTVLTVEQGAGITAFNVCLALSQSDEYRSIYFDLDKAAYTALTYLEEHGHIGIGFIGTSSSMPYENACYDSFAAVHSGFDEDFTVLSSPDEKGGFEGYSELFRKHGAKLTAVCTANDAIARGVLKAAKYYKTDVPGSLSVISLCSTDKKEKLDRILFDADGFARELLYSLENSGRICSILFGGNLSASGTVTDAPSTESKGSSMKDFLL